MADPPSLGAVQLRVIDPSPGVPVNGVGAPGTPSALPVTVPVPIV